MSCDGLVSVQGRLTDVTLERMTEFCATKHQQTDRVVKVQNVACWQSAVHVI